MEIMKKNSILFLTNTYPDFESSYRGIFIKKMAILLKDEGYDISVVTPKIYGRSHYFEEQNRIKVYRFSFFARDKLLIEHKKIPYLRMILYYITGFFLTIYAMFKNRCNLIHVHWAIPTGLIGVLVGSLLKKPVIVTIHGSDFRMAMATSGFLKKVFVYICNKASHLNCVSEVQKNELEQLGISNKKITILPMGVDGTFLEKGKYRKIESNYRPFTILSNRNLLPIYNVSLLIRAIPMVLKEEPDTKFLIAGEGSEKEVLEREAKDLNIHSHIKFLGRVPHEEMPNLLARANIYVSTSLHDGTSVSLLEAMAAGAFPIVTDITSNREWIKDGGNGFLVPVNDEQYLANKIIDAIRDKGLLEKARKENQSISEEKTLWPVCIKKIKKIYEDQKVGSEI
ncbi:MAG: glycosyltransferase [Deltaproteobacteria bacterium]|nr:glycosyltransferase [Deltaproteobacteria bacterium]